MPSDSRTSDPTVLRAIAHPVRSRVLEELYAAGSLRAADVAARVGIPANQASFHLRQLAKYGVIEDAPELARDGRDRVWRPVSERGFDLDLAEVEQQPGGRAAATVWRRQAAADARDFVGRAFSPDHAKNTRVMVADIALRLSKEEATRFADELTELAERWREQVREGDDSRLTYRLLQVLQPYDDRVGGQD